MHLSRLKDINTRNARSDGRLPESLSCERMSRSLPTGGASNYWTADRFFHRHPSSFVGHCVLAISRGTI